MNMLIKEYNLTGSFSSMPIFNGKTVKKEVNKFVNYVLADIDTIFKKDLTEESFLKFNNSVCSLYAMYSYILYLNHVSLCEKDKTIYEDIYNNIYFKIDNIFKVKKHLKKFSTFQSTLNKEDKIKFQKFIDTYCIDISKKESTFDNNAYLLSQKLDQDNNNIVSFGKKDLIPSFVEKKEKETFTFKLERKNFELIIDDKSRKEFVTNYENQLVDYRKDFINLINKRKELANKQGYKSYFEYKNQNNIIVSKTKLEKLLKEQRNSLFKELSCAINKDFNVSVDKTNVDYLWKIKLDKQKEVINNILNKTDLTIEDIFTNAFKILEKDFKLKFTSLSDMKNGSKYYEVYNKETKQKGTIVFINDKVSNYAITINNSHNKKAFNNFIGYIYLYNLESDWTQKISIKDIEVFKTMFHELGHFIHISNMNFKYSLLNRAVLESNNSSIPLDMLEYPSVLLENYAMTTNVLKKVLLNFKSNEIKDIQQYLNDSSLSNDLLQNIISYNKYKLFSNNNKIKSYDELYEKNNFFAFNFLLNKEFFNNFNSDCYLITEYNYSLGNILSNKFLNNKENSIKDLFMLIYKSKKEINNMIDLHVS